MSHRMTSQKPRGPSKGSPLLRIAAAVSLLFGIAAWTVYRIDRSPLEELPDSLTVRRDVAYGSGGYQKLDIIHAPGSSRLRPALMMLHPGAWMQGDKASHHAMMAEYAQLGYVTLSLNFRPSGAAKYPAALQDCKRAVRWLRVHAADYGVDPARIGVTGYSSGAHLTLLLALSDDAFEKDEAHPDVSSRVQAAVGVSGVYDLLMESRGAFPNADNDAALLRFLGESPAQNPDLARRASPLTHLTPDDPPLLLFHGEQDRRIDAEQARHFARASRALGRRDDVVLLPEAGHGRDVLPEDLRSRQLIREFFARQLRPGE